MSVRDWDTAPPAWENLRARPPWTLLAVFLFCMLAWVALILSVWFVVAVFA